MNRSVVPVALALALLAPVARAQEGDRAASRTAEPSVQRTVVEDDRVRIEELRVRGQLQRVVVTPKGGARPYEVLVGEGGRPVQDGSGASRGGAGQRVWHVLSF